MSDGFDLADLADVFYQEAVELLQRLEQGVLVLEKSPANTDVVKEVFRAAHTLKGSSGTMGYDQVTALTHAMENLLDGVRSGRLSVNAAITNLLLRCVDTLRIMVDAIREGDDSARDTTGLLAELASATATNSGPAPQPEQHADAAHHAEPSAPAVLEQRDAPVPDGCVRIVARVAETCLMPSIRGFMVYHALASLGDLVSSDPTEDDLDSLPAGGSVQVILQPAVPLERIQAALQSISEVTAHVEPASQTDRTSADSAHLETDDEPRDASTEAMGLHPSQTVRVAVERLDNLMNLVGELVIGRTRVDQISSDLSDVAGMEMLTETLREASQQLARVTGDLQEQITRIRMLPVDQVFSRFPRMVRDLAQRAGKQVEFVITGGDTELDRSILEDIVDPITHLLRNAVDHGVETPEARQAAGKPARAVIQLAARHEDNRIVIEVSDDGAGIPLGRVRQAAVDSGRISEEAAQKLTNRELTDLVFEAGVSTASRVTDISGRGVGMDVVRNTIQRLSGSLDLETEPQQGTTVRMRLPLTLAILQALVTESSKRVFAIPLSCVQETGRCQSSDIRRVEGRPVLYLRQTVLPLVYLHELFPTRRPMDVHNAKLLYVVVRVAGTQVALAVDRLIGEQEVVIKPLRSEMTRVQGLTGAALLGDGRIALVLDTVGLGPVLERLRARAMA